MNLPIIQEDDFLKLTDFEWLDRSSQLYIVIDWLLDRLIDD